MILDNKEEELKLLSKILATEGDTFPWYETFLKVKQVIDKELVDALDDAKYPDKAAFMEELNRFLVQLKLLLRYPSLKGKTVVGVMHDSVSSRKYFYQTIIQPTNEMKLLLKNRTIPILHSNSGENRISFYTPYQKEAVEPKTLKLFLSELDSHYRMDLRQIMTHFLSEKKLQFNHLAFFDFTLAANREESFLNLIEKTDLFLVNIAYKNGWEKPLRFLSKIGYDKEILIQVSETKGELTSLLKSLGLRFKIVKDNVEERLKSYDLPNNHALFLKKIDQLIMEVCAYVYEQRTVSYIHMEKINKSLLLLESADKNGLVEFRTRVQSDIDRDSLTLESLQKISSKIHNIIGELVDAFSVEGESKGLLPHYMDILYKLAISYLKYDKPKEMMELAAFLIENGYKKGHLLLLAADEKKGNVLNKTSLEALHSMTSIDDDVISAKIRYRKNLGFSDNQAISLSLKLNKTNDPDILYFLGSYYAKTDQSKAIKYYRYALENGNIQAGEELYHLYESNKSLLIPNLKFLGNHMITEANFKLGKLYLSKNNEKSAIIHFSLAAINEHQESILHLADLFYHKKDYTRAIEYYQTLRKYKGKTNHKITQNLGTCYYQKKDYHNAYETLKNCPRGEAYFMIGQIYEKGLGKIANVTKALPYFEKGKNVGHQKSATHYLKITTRLEEEKKKKEQEAKKSYNSNASYTRSTSSSYSSSKSGCFLTTATCTALGKEDNCEEILAFKEFRDKWLISQSDGPSIIKEYYRMAPSLVNEINSRSNPLEIYQYLWDKFMQTGYEYLLDQNYEMAKQTYIQMVLEVQRDYS